MPATELAASIPRIAPPHLFALSSRRRAWAFWVTGCPFFAPFNFCDAHEPYIVPQGRFLACAVLVTSCSERDHARNVIVSTTLEM